MKGIYYFNLKRRQTTILDERGRCESSLADAHRRAVRIAESLSDHPVAQQRGWTVQVVGPVGVPAMSVPIIPVRSGGSVWPKQA